MNSHVTQCAFQVKVSEKSRKAPGRHSIRDSDFARRDLPLSPSFASGGAAGKMIRASNYEHLVVSLWVSL